MLSNVDLVKKQTWVEGSKIPKMSYMATNERGGREGRTQDCVTDSCRDARSGKRQIFGGGRRKRTVEKKVNILLSAREYDMPACGDTLKAQNCCLLPSVDRYS